MQVRDAHKRYATVDALAGVDLELGAGEWVGLLGPNGAGKSTLMNAIAGLVPLDGGMIDLLDQQLDRVPIGFVPQEIALYPRLTVRENLRLFGRLHRLRRTQLSQRVEWALSWTDLGSRADSPVDQLSGGMQRRLNIACGVLHRPRLVLLDEPTVGVDPHARARIWDMLDELRTGGATLLQSTHGLSEIESLCDRMLILDRGRIIAAGTVEELVDEHLGETSTVRLELDRPLDDAFPRNGFDIRGSTLLGTLGDVARELPPVLAKLADAGFETRAVRVDRATLADVFSHLTGRELRE